MSLGRSASVTSNPTNQTLFEKILEGSGYDAPQQFKHLTLAGITRHKPSAVVVDLENLKTDRLEGVRQLRFVLPQCTIAIVSTELNNGWAAQCHLAGANCVLTTNGVARMTGGLRIATSSGCYTDRAFHVDGKG